MRRWLMWGSALLILFAWWFWLAGRPRFETGRWHEVGASQIRLERVLIGTTVQPGGFRQPPEWLNYVFNRVPVLWNWWDKRQEHWLEAPPGLQLVYVEASGYAAREVLESMDFRVDVGYGTYGTRSRSLNRPDTGPAAMEFVVELPDDAEVQGLELKVGDKWALRCRPGALSRPLPTSSLFCAAGEHSTAGGSETAARSICPPKGAST